MQTRIVQLSFWCLLFSALSALAASPEDDPDASTDTDGDQDQEAVRPIAEQPDSNEPGYDLPAEARSPFQPFSAYRESLQPEEEEPETQELTEEIVRRHVTLDAIVSAGDRKTAVINRTLLRTGDSLTIEQNDQVYTLEVEELKRTPPTAILAHGDRQFTVTAGK